MTNYKPKVVHDFTTIHEKFPCNKIVNEFLQNFVRAKNNEKNLNFEFKLSQFFSIYFNIVQVAKTVKFEGNICKIKAHTANAAWSPLIADFSGELTMQSLESLLSSRLTDETYRGAINFYKATVIDTPIDDIAKTLVSKNEKNMYISLINVAVI